MITVDNGIASCEGVEEANRLGMRVVITDHHLPGEQLPDAAAIVNPNQPGCGFPSKNLAGVGVLFYVMTALRAELRRRGAFAGRAEPNLAALLDLVALGTVADVVRLDGNNRILVAQGIARIRAGEACAGIRALLAVAGREPGRATAYDLGFVVGPRLNAAGRLEDMTVVWDVIVVGMGDIGHALARYNGFSNRGFRVTMLFDNDPEKVGQKVGDFEIYDTSTLAEKVKQNKVKIAMLTVPATAAPEITDQLVKAGIKAILNYAPINLSVPSNVRVQYIDPVDTSSE